MREGHPRQRRSLSFAKFHLARACVFACVLARLGSGLGAADSQLVIHWKSSTDPAATDLLKDRNGNLLDRGLPANRDGYLVTLGYFKEANAAGSDSDMF